MKRAKLHIKPAFKMNQTTNNVQVEDYKRLAESGEIENFLTLNQLEDESRLLLRHKEVSGIPMSIVVNQLSGHRKAKAKLPSYYHRSGIVYPPNVNLEQSSSEKTAELKARILTEVTPSAYRIIDLTGGFGIDSYFFARVFSVVEYVEPDVVLAWIASHNHRILGAGNVTYHTNFAEQFLNRDLDPVEAVFIDPSRRKNATKGVLLRDCEPDVVKLQSRIFEISKFLLIKTSPLLDITAALRELSYVWRVYVVSVDHECRELLFLCQQGYTGEPRIHTIHLHKDFTETFDFSLAEEKATDVSYGAVLNYLYEPNPSLMKAGAFRSIARAFNISKLHVNSHLYTSETYLAGFPGRIFEVLSRIPGNGRGLERFLPERKANVVVRNYPLSAEQLKKKFGLSDGGSDYVIGTTSQTEGKLVLFARRHR